MDDTPPVYEDVVPPREDIMIETLEQLHNTWNTERVRIANSFRDERTACTTRYTDERNRIDKEYEQQMSSINVRMNKQISQLDYERRIHIRGFVPTNTTTSWWTVLKKYILTLWEHDEGAQKYTDAHVQLHS